MRLIDADALIAKAYIMQEPNGFIHSVVTERQIAKAPTIDAVPVVRCKDCKNREFENLDAIYHWCEEHAWYVTDDDFCSYGERKDGDA